MDNLEFIYNRMSVRKFEEKEVPQEDLEKMIKAATYAPSAKNSQNWHFVVVTNKDKIMDMSKAVEDRAVEIVKGQEETEQAVKFMKMIKYYTVFKNAPAVVLIYGTNYDASGYDVLKASGVSSKELHALLKPSPGIQNCAAAMENLLLSASNMGYGGCWMTGPNFAAEKISKAIGFEKEGYELVCLTPIGTPVKSNHPQPPRKAIEEVTTFIK
jgi:nitroreductase